MTPDEYQMLAHRTAKRFTDRNLDLIHPTLGLQGESGEYTDAIKRHVIYGKPLDVGNCIEELGDAMWYIALACSTLNVSMENVMRLNIEKLQRRYPEKYSDEAAIARADKQIKFAVKDKFAAAGYYAAGPFDTHAEAVRAITDSDDQEIVEVQV